MKKQENKEQSENTVIKRRLKGVVSSTKMERTAAVKVTRQIRHARYHKIYKSSKNYMADVGKVKVEEGDKVIIEAIRPMSKTKRWRIIKKI